MATDHFVRLRPLVLTAVVTAGMSGLSPQSEGSEPAAKKPVPDDKNSEVVAQLFKKNITRDDLEKKAKEAGQKPSEQLQAMIFLGLLERRFKKENIEPQPAEVQQLAKALNKDIKGDVKKDSFEYEFAAHMVRQWNMDRVLYKEYGGEVIWQQFNPTEPVGAYRRFLEDMEKKGNFKIFDKSMNDHFWKYFRQKHLTTAYDFDTPYWRKK